MAKVKLLVGFARTAGGWNAGDVVDVSNSEAEAMINAGFALIAELKQEEIEVPEVKEKRVYNKRVKK